MSQEAKQRQLEYKEEDKESGQGPEGDDESIEELEDVPMGVLVSGSCASC